MDNDLKIAITNKYKEHIDKCTKADDKVNGLLFDLQNEYVHKQNLRKFKMKYFIFPSWEDKVVTSVGFRYKTDIDIMVDKVSINGFVNVSIIFESGGYHICGWNDNTVVDGIKWQFSVNDIMDDDKFKEVVEKFIFKLYTNFSEYRRTKI